MKWLLLFTCFISFWIYSDAQTCELEGVTPTQWTFSYENDPIDDDNYSLLLQFASTDITGVTVTGGDTIYFDVSFDSVNNNLEIRLTAAFAQYEELTASAPQHIIGINLAFTCTVGTRTLRINQPITDINNHEPTFLSSVYSYALPMPFPQNIDVTNFGDAIEAIDIDITNTRVTFSIEPAGDFIITYDGVVGNLNKQHRARIYAARPLRLTQSTLYTLRVTDMGNPQLSTTAQLQITVDEEASLKQSPSFGKAFYIAEYAADATNKVDASLDLDLHGSTASSVLISGDHSELFEYTATGTAINVRLTGSLPEEVLLESTFIALTVEVTVDNAEYNGRTALIVSIPQPETTTTACPTEPTISTTACPEPPTTTECAECICTTTEVTPCPETPTTAECVCTTTETTPCPETPTTAECVCTTTETTPCPETPTTSECVCTTTEVTPCPETPTTSECVCTTTEVTPCPETPTTSECVCTTTEVTPCPETPTTTECVCETTVCPSTSTETTCPETSATTECICPTTPETTTVETCEPCECNTTTTNTTPTGTTTTTEYNCPTETTTTPEVCLPCPETSTTTDCTMCTTTTDCPSTLTTTTPVDCPNVCTDSTTTTTDCPQDCSECPTTSTTDCPHDCSECPTTSTTDCPHDCSECPTTTTTDCPQDCSECSTTSTTAIECPSTSTETPTCPTPETTTLADCSLCPTDCPTQTSTTETEKTTEETTATTCPTTETSTSCDCTNTSTSSTVCPETECPVDCSACTTVSNVEPPESTTTHCPELDCTLCSTTTSVTTVTTATPPNTGNVLFEQEVYTFRLSPTHDIDYTFQASSSIQEAIVYDLTNTEGPLPTALSFNRNTGRLTNNGYLTSGLYQLVVAATGQESEDTATAAVVISVGSAEVCEDGSIRTSYAFKLSTITENTEGIVLFKGEREEIADYNFCIEHQYPFQSGAFYINEETGNVESRPVDREAAIFENMDPAQFTLTLQLNYGPVSQNCPITTMSSFRSVFIANNSTRAGDSRQCVHMDNEIFNEPQKTVLAVVVLDDNDNDPVFETYAMTVGYPKQALSSRVSPPQIIRVEATDADIGINAALNYFLENDERVTIHSTTGVIYPSDQIYIDENDFEITVFARDENGAGRTSQPLNIQIRFLDENHISILTINDVLLEDMDVSLNQIQSNTGIRIRALTASVLPNSEVTRTVRAGGAAYLRVTGYALDQNDELVETTQLQGMLENVQGLQVQPLPNNDGDGGSDDPLEEESVVGWIAAVSVLSVLLALVIIAFILAYFFIFRKSKAYTHMEEDGSTPTTTPAATPQFQKNSKLEFTGSKSGVDVSQRRSTGYIFGQSAGGDTGETETDDNKETRKSVSFNTNVERIDIEREAETEGEVKTESKQDTSPTLSSDVKKEETPEIEVHRL